MTPKQTQDKRSDDIESRLSLVEYRTDEMLKKLDRIETKQDASIRQIDTLKYVNAHEFDSYKEYAEKRYVTVKENSAMRVLFWAAVGAVVTGVIGLGLNLLAK